MIVFQILILGSALLVHGKGVAKECKDLKWPEKYTFKALRVYLGAGVTENCQMWKTPKKSRMDYDNAMDRTIVDKESYKYGLQYKIYPETNDEEKIKTACEVLRGNFREPIDLDEVLPEPEGFKEIGTELLNDVMATKFFYDYLDDEDSNINIQRTIWATFDPENKIWKPVRYETIELNTWYGTRDKHEIWDFEGFHTNVTEEDFSIDKSCDDAVKIRLKEDEAMRYTDPENDKHVNRAFKVFKRKYKKNYGKEEQKMRKSLFRRTMRLVAMTNRQNLGYKLKINKFADRTSKEMFQYTGLRSRPENTRGIEFPYSHLELKEMATTLPTEYDTRLYGLVGSVKHQENCGSCWTFGTTASMEGAVAKRYGKFVTLSNQAIIDCAWPYGAAGCDGGSDTAAYEFIKDYGIPSQAEYGDYLNQNGYCHIKNMTKLYRIRGFVDVTPNSVEALKVALVNNGPISVSVNVNEAFKVYSGGIFYDSKCDPYSLNHEVTLVGYGEKDGETFWILKNSWGREWGIDGFMHIAARNNCCGVTHEPTYPIIE